MVLYIKQTEEQKRIKKEISKQNRREREKRYQQSEKYKENKRQWREKNKEKRNKYQREWLEKNKDYFKNYYDKIWRVKRGIKKREKWEFDFKNNRSDRQNTIIIWFNPWEPRELWDIDY